MRIISVRQGLASDHSSTSYEFLALDRPLDEEARRAVASRSSRADPDRRRVSFVYHSDSYDLPGGWHSLMQDHYDVMYRESYDWWVLAVAFNASEEQIEQIARYDFTGADDLGVTVRGSGQRVIVSIWCQMDNGAFMGEDDYSEDGYEEPWYDEDAGNDEDGYDVSVDCSDELLQFLAQVRKQLMDADYRCLYAVWQVYGWGEDEEADEDDEDFPIPPVPAERPTGGELAEYLQSILRCP